MKEKNQERRLGQFLVNNKAIVIFLFLAIVLSFATDNFMTKTNLLNMVRQVCVMSVMSVGFTLILASGSIDLSVGYMLGLVGVFCALISKIAGLPVILVLLFSILFGMFLGFCNAFLFLTFKMPPFIVTLSTAQIFRGVTHLLCDGTPVSGLPDAIIAIGQDYFCLLYTSLIYRSLSVGARHSVYAAGFDNSSSPSTYRRSNEALRRLKR